MDKETFNALYLGLAAIITFFAFLIPWYKKRKHRIPNIIAAEKKRRKHPDIQNGKFTRLYTMPYCEELDGKVIYEYFKEHFPDYECIFTEDFVQICEKRSEEKRELHIVQLRNDDITAIELVDPREIESHSRYATQTRSSLHDLGFGESVRGVIRHFQQKAITHQRI